MRNAIPADTEEEPDTMSEKHDEVSFWGGIVKSMGLVFGDIGTSPIYTLTVIFALTEPTPENVFGILSLVFWTMTILVTVEYAWLAMSLGRKGQGGEIVLREILIKLLKQGRCWVLPASCPLSAFRCCLATASSRLRSVSCPRWRACF